LSIVASLVESGAVFFQVSPEIFNILGGFDSQSRQSQKSGFPSAFRDGCGVVKDIEKKFSVPFGSHSAILAQRFGDIHGAMDSADDSNDETEHRESNEGRASPPVGLQMAVNLS
jgi:hypothetical protein